MSIWYTSNCRETKEVLGIDYTCCGSCHEDVYYGFRDCIEKYTKFKDLLFYGCCGFSNLNDEEWKIFEEKLLKYRRKKNDRI